MSGEVAPPPVSTGDVVMIRRDATAVVRDMRGCGAVVDEVRPWGIVGQALVGGRSIDDDAIYYVRVAWEELSQVNGQLVRWVRQDAAFGREP